MKLKKKFELLQREKDMVQREKDRLQQANEALAVEKNQLLEDQQASKSSSRERRGADIRITKKRFTL